MGAFLTESISAVKYFNDAEQTIRFNLKTNSVNERAQTYKRWWKEQVRLYGTKIDYYVRNFALSATDKVYGENAHQGYHPKATFVMLIDLSDGSLTYSQYGLVSDDELKTIHTIASYLAIGAKDFESIKTMFFDEKLNAYKVLEITESATDAEVKRAYRTMVKKYHPDRVSHLGEEHLKGAEEKFRTVQKAYEYIQNKRGFK